MAQNETLPNLHGGLRGRQHRKLGNSDSRHRDCMRAGFLLRHKNCEGGMIDIINVFLIAAFVCSIGYMFYGMARFLFWMIDDER